VIIYSVGVFGSNVTQLEEISGRPEMVFYVENFDILQHIEDELVLGICSPREGEDRCVHKWNCPNTACVSELFLNAVNSFN
jgi:hypothetical protein